MSALNFLPFGRTKKQPRKLRRQQPRSLWNKYFLNLEKLEDRITPSTEVWHATLPSTPTDFTGDDAKILSLPQFDTQGGYRVLDRVAIAVTTRLDTTTSGSVTNSGSTTVRYRAIVDGSSLLTDLPNQGDFGLIATGPGINPLASNVYTNTGFITVAGGQTKPVSASASDPEVENVPAVLDLTPFIDPSTGHTVDYTFDGSAVANVTVSGGGNLVQAVNFNTTGQGSVDITYTYHFTTDLSITKDDGSPTAVPGTNDTYTIIVTNNGLGPVDPGAVVSDVLPAGTTFVSATNGAT